MSFGLEVPPLSEEIKNFCTDLATHRTRTSNPGETNTDGVSYATFAKSGILWDPQQLITYAFLDGTPAQQHKVEDGIEAWRPFVYLTFQKYELDQAQLAKIRISFNAGLGNWSFVAKDSAQVLSDKPTMNLGAVSDSSEQSPEERGVILHQLGHMLGMTHEHSQSDALNSEAITSLYKNTQNWSEQKIQMDILDVYASSNLTNFGTVHHNSIMVCAIPPPLALDGKGVLSVNDLSFPDMAWAYVHYYRGPGDSSIPYWTLPRALDELGVPSGRAQEILAAGANDTRKQFTIWLAETLVAHAAEVPQSGQPAKGTDDSRPAWFQRTCTDLDSHGQKMTTLMSVNEIAFAVFSKSSNLWRDGQDITYSYLGGTDTQARKVDQTIQEWLNYANIRFRKLDNGGQVRITFNADDGSWSYVGNQALKIAPSKATMNLGWIEVDGPVSSQERGTILHEFGHVLGLMHEHQSPARGHGLTLDEARVYEYYTRTQGWSRELVKRQILDVYNVSDISNYSELDTKSIMMYFLPAEMNLERIEVPPNSALSDLDKAYMVINYPFQTRNPKWDLAYALDIAGVSGATKDSILKETDADVIRSLFSVWSAAQHGAEASRDINDSGGTLETWCDSQEPYFFQEVSRGIESSDGDEPARAVSITDQTLWQPGEEIRYCFQQLNLGGAFDVRRNAFVRYLGEYAGLANLRFRQVDPSEDPQVKVSFYSSRPGYGVFKPVDPNDPDKFDPTLACWCKIGKTCIGWINETYQTRGGNLQTTFFLNVPAFEPQPGSQEDEYTQRRFRHEMGHMIGLIHEQNSPQTETIDPVSGDAGISTAFDFKSIMLYSRRPLKKDNTQTTGDKQNFVLSETDKYFIRALYPDNPLWESGLFQAALAGLGILTTATIETYYHSAFDSKRSPAQRRLSVAQMRNAIREQLLVKDPSNDVSGPARDASNIAQDFTEGKQISKGAFLPVFLAALKEFFNPGGNQSFVLQFPGRFLQISQYAWDTGTAGIYGQFIKPIVVNESEFRLTDQLYDANAEVVGGPNGISLSQVYEQVINNLLPAFKSNGLGKQQDQIRKWLLRDVKPAGWIKDLIQSQHDDVSQDQKSPLINGGQSSISGDKPQFAISNKLTPSGTVNRIELSNALMQEYLQAKQAWEVERDQMIEEALKLQLGTQESAAALNSLTRRLAHTTAAREAQLTSKYSDAVVRGYTHNVREYVGYLDVKTPAEALQDAKDALRESAASSLDGSLKVYPVQMTPIDWFEGLSTSFQLEDLTQDPDLIYQQIRAKSQQVDTLYSQLAVLRFGTKGDPAKLKADVEEAQRKLDKAQADLAVKYSTNVIALAKTCFVRSGALDTAQLQALKNDLPGVAIDQLIGDIQATSEAQTLLTSTSRAFSQALAEYALAQATDTKQQQEQIRLQVESLTKDINELTARYTSLNQTNNRPKTQDPNVPSTVKLSDIPSFPAANDTAGGSRWQEIEFYHEIESNYSRDSTSASSSASSTHVNLWIYSSSSSESSSRADANSTTASYSNKVCVAFRATLVTVDRAGWFQPQFFKQSGSFYHIDPAVSWSNSNNGSKALLPAFPIGYILCKDITVKIGEATSTTSAAKRNMKEDSASSGGVLCFSYSRSRSASSSENSYSFQSCADGCVIRIPGPQILGYIMERTDPDLTDDMPKTLPDDFFIPDADYDAATADGGSSAAAHDVNTSGPSNAASPLFRELDEVLKQSNVPSSAVEAIHQAFRKQLNSLS